MSERKWETMPELRTGDIVRTLEPMRTTVYEGAPTALGSCLSRDLPTDVDIPVGTEARVERGEGRWGEEALWLHFELPGLPPFSKVWGLENWPRLVKVQDVRDLRMTYGLPFPPEG